MDLNDNELKFWNKYLKTLENSLENDFVEAGIAGDPNIANELLELFLNGKKTAASGLVKDYEICDEELPEIGEHWIILDVDQNPKCIVKTIKVVFNRFDQIPLEIAIAEGEGDLSLEYWQKAHVEFFTPFLKEWGIADLNSEMVVTEFYKLVYKE